MKNVIATVVGFIVASATVFLIENLIGHSLFPLPEGVDPMDIEWIKANMDKIPVGAKVCVVIGHFMGIVVGMFTASKISKTSMIPCYIVGGLMLLATIFNIITLPKELWFSLSDGILAIIGFLIGKRLSKNLVK
ncbi:MAG: hypothetical protein HRU50_02350 [Winogradskyella sp.]|uniref:hypothetical protein n=1 Tax=Winogradskyella sp. TaxID=1883156 RepID=UPI0025FB0B51|nr:hypothetical protein [Winogradskyella sp.]NRB58762.1 hypothetical protein [Winogradskyella sp.]